MTINKYKRVFVIVTDGVGIGKDSLQESMGDKGANTMAGACASGLCNLPTWERLGIGLIATTSNPYACKIKPKGYVAQVESTGVNKNTLSGHLEMMGIVSSTQIVNYEQGFPVELISALKSAWDDRTIFGNRMADGVQIVTELHREAEADKGVIVYTSPDSTLQVAANETIIPPDLLWEYCIRAREITNSRPEWHVDRVIARPYRVGEEGQIIRTYNRRDYVNSPPHNILDELHDAGVYTISIGKIYDIFAGRAIDESHKGGSDDENMDYCINIAEEAAERATFVFANLVQFDSHYGHRRNPDGFAENLNRFDTKLAKFIRAMQNDDLLIIVSDHGNDPCYRGSDHTRELIPLTIYAHNLTAPRRLEKIWGMSVVGNILLENFGLPTWENGNVLLTKIL